MAGRATPLFTGLTRQPELMGVPVHFSAIGATIPVALFVLTQNAWCFALIVAIYPLFLYLARRDPYLVAVLRTSLTRTPGIANRAVWGGNGYGH